MKHNKTVAATREINNGNLQQFYKDYVPVSITLNCSLLFEANFIEGLINGFSEPVPAMSKEETQTLWRDFLDRQRSGAQSTTMYSDIRRSIQ